MSLIRVKVVKMSVMLIEGKVYLACQEKNMGES